MLINNEMGNLTASRSLTLLEAEMEQFAVSLTVCVSFILQTRSQCVTYQPSTCEHMSLFDPS